MNINNINTVKDRIKLFIGSQNMNVKQFEHSISASNGYVNSISKSIGGDKLRLISREYPNLNTDWLLTGEGEMLLPNSDTKKAAPDQERLYIEQRVEKLEQEIRELSSLTASLRKTIQGLIEEMNELKQGASKRVSSKSSKDAG